MEPIPCQKRRFPLVLKSIVVRVETTYTFWLQYLTERLGSDVTEKIWADAFKKYDQDFLEQILASGWLPLEKTQPKKNWPTIQALPSSFVDVKGMNPDKTQEFSRATPPLPEIKAHFPYLDVQRDTTTYEALHLYIHGLALLTEALINSFGKQGELIAYDILSAGKTLTGQDMGGSVSDFMRDFDEQLKKPDIYAAGLDVEIMIATANEHVCRVTHCEWARYFMERHPSVGYLVACSTDEAFGRGYNKHLRMQRKSTIMEGGSECDFRWYSVEQQNDGAIEEPKREKGEQKQMKKHQIPLTALAVLLAVPSFAQEQFRAARNIHSLDEVVVTATKTERELKDVSTNMVVLTEKDIEQYQPTDTMDLLRHVPGLVLNGMGSSKASFYAGSRGIQPSSRGMLIMMDGVEMNDPSNYIAVSNVPLEAVERIEIVKTPASVLYGPAAVGGVINIITKKPGKAMQADASLGYGSFDRKEVSANLSGLLDNGFSYGLNYRGLDTDGYRANSQRSQHAFTPRIGYFSEAVEFDLFANIVDAEYGFPGGLPLGS
ncbi:MAG: hypothetical protein D3907_12255, partial [Candidatus Electrothrix sp. AUS3]|nr:hypothetical protein [Candidatus Electrothrix gigas]